MRQANHGEWDLWVEEIRALVDQFLEEFMRNIVAIIHGETDQFNIFLIERADALEPKTCGL